MPSLLLILTMATMAMVWATMVDIAAMDLDMATTMARGLLMPRLMLIPTSLATAMVWVMDTMAATMAMVWDMAMVDMAMDVATTGDKSSHQKEDWAIHEDLSVNHQLLCQRQMDYFSLSFIPHLCCQF